MNSDTNKLIETVNVQFELLDFMESFQMDNEALSLKISLNNLLKCFSSYEKNKSDQEIFYQILIMSTPIFFDFLYNDFTNKNNKILKTRYARTKYYNQARKWYKFVRNTLIHTNRYTHNNFTQKIYRIDYVKTINVYFELSKEGGYGKFQKFTNNRFLNNNIKVVEEKYGQKIMFTDKENVQIPIDYDNFIQFVFNETKLFIKFLETETDRLLLVDMQKWEQYKKLYVQIVNDILINKIMNFNDIRKMIMKLREFINFSDESIFIVLEFFNYLHKTDYKLTEKYIDNIVSISIIDTYSQIEEKNLIIENIKVINEIQNKYRLSKKQFIDYTRELGMNVNINKLENVQYTNYLIVYIESYIQMLLSKETIENKDNNMI